MLSALGELALGLVILLAGGELLVRASSALARILGMSSLIIGLTVVSFGTSAPELVVSVKSAWSGQADIALGNVVGSNIANILLILGLSAIIAPLRCATNILRRDMPIMLAASVLTILLAYNGTIGRLEGLLLFTCLVLQTVFAISQERVDANVKEEVSGPAKNSSAVLALLVAAVAASLVLLALGADMFTDAASTLARMAGVSELTIGLTVVAIGTSLPELVTSGVAAFRGQSDIAIGNVVGSNIFNLLCVLGLSSLVSPIHVSPVALRFDMPVMLLVSIVLYPMLLSGLSISRFKGKMLLAGYGLYVCYLVIAG